MEYSRILVRNCAFRLGLRLARHTPYKSSTIVTHAGTFFLCLVFFCVVRFPVIFAGANLGEVITHVY